MGKRSRPDIREQFAVNDRQEALGLTQGKLAAWAGIHRTYLSDIGRARTTSDRMRPRSRRE